MAEGNISKEDLTKLSELTDSFQTVVKEHSLFKLEGNPSIDLFTQMARVYKTNGEGSLFTLNSLVRKYDPSSSEVAYLSKLYQIMYDQYNLIGKDLQMMLGKTPTVDKDSQKHTIIISEFEKITSNLRSKEHEFLSDKSNETLKDLLQNYKDVCELIMVGIGRFREDEQEAKVHEESYVKFSELISMDSFFFEQIDDIIEQKHENFINLLTSGLTEVVQNFYRSESEKEIQKLVNSKLKALSKEKKISSVISEIDSYIDAILKRKIDFSKLSQEIKALSCQTDEKKKLLENIYQLLLNFNKIFSEEIALKRERIESDHYQLAFLFIFFRAVIKVLFVGLYRSIRYRIEEGISSNDFL